MTFKLENIIRPNIKVLKPYSSARNEFSGDSAILLDANENPFNQPLNRYPDPLQKKLKKRISELYRVDENRIFLGNGSDEAIDLLFRAFCEPGKDRALSIEPSYGMYQVCADIQGVELDKALLNPDLTLNKENITKEIKRESKLLFFCSPNNPGANLLDKELILDICSSFNGLVVVDEAYVEFSGSVGLLGQLADYPNLIVLRTFSKSWGMAGIRLGMAFGSPDLIDILTNIKYPYNLNTLTQEYALKKLEDTGRRDEWIKTIIGERKLMEEFLSQRSFVNKIFPSDANFLLVKVKNADELYSFLKKLNIIIRNRSKLILCEECLRFTIGSPEENQELKEALLEYESQF